MNSPVFILGAPRSGTTFLASLLNLTQYGKPFETHFITKYYKLLHTYGNLNEYKNFQKLLRHILNERPVAQWDLTFDTFEFYQSLLPNIQFNQLVNKLCLKAAQMKGYENWGDKTPHYIGELEIIYKLFPNSKYIYIVRDGRDVALSLLKKPWGPNNIYYCAKQWAKLNEENVILNKLQCNGQLFSLRYEDLLDKTNEYTKDIYSFLGCNFSSDDIKQITSGVKTGNYNKWINTLSAKQVRIFESVAADALLRFGYQVISKKLNTISFTNKIAYTIHNYALLYKHLLVLNLIDGFKIKFLGKQPFAE